jgi:tetratricopeptide (TPR) repeat protein
MLAVVAAIYEYDWKEAAHQFELAMAQVPVPPQVRSWYGWFYLLPLGRLEHAVQEQAKALAEDPFNGIGRVCLAMSLQLAGKLDEEAAELERAIDRNDNLWVCILFASIHLLQGHPDWSLTFAQRAHDLAPSNPNSIAVLAAVLNQTGDTSRSTEVLGKLRETSDSYGAPRGLSYFHYLLKEMDEAAHWGEKVIDQRDPMAQLSYGLFRFTSNWPKLAKLMNLPPTAS